MTTVTTDPCRRRARALLAHVWGLGVRLRARGADLLIADRDGHLTPPLRAQLLELKDLVVSYLQNAETLDAFASSGEVRSVCSQVLGEEVLFAADNAALPADTGGRVVYRARELALLAGVTPEHLRRIHEAKRVFGGEVVA